MSLDLSGPGSDCPWILGPLSPAPGTTTLTASAQPHNPPCPCSDVIPSKNLGGGPHALLSFGCSTEFNLPPPTPSPQNTHTSAKRRPYPVPPVPGTALIGAGVPGTAGGRKGDGMGHPVTPRDTGGPAGGEPCSSPSVEPQNLRFTAQKNPTRKPRHPDWGRGKGGGWKRSTRTQSASGKTTGFNKGGGRTQGWSCAPPPAPQNPDTKVGAPTPSHGWARGQAPSPQGSMGQQDTMGGSTM